MKFDFFQSFKFDLKFLWNWLFFHYEKNMRFIKCLQLPWARRTRMWHHHGSDTPTSPRAILLHTIFYTFLHKQLFSNYSQLIHSPILNLGANDIVIMELYSFNGTTIKFTDTPNLGPTGQKNKRKQVTWIIFWL